MSSEVAIGPGSPPLSVVTWNVLADAYIRREYYPHSTDLDLDPDRRLQALCEALARLDADVLCLQEVDDRALEAFASALPGHERRFARKGADKPDGCATFVRAPWAIVAEHVLPFSDGEPPSGHVALTLVLSVGVRHLAVTNTHLRWADPGLLPGEHVGCRQARELIERRPDAPWVVCGDLNASPGESVMQMLHAAGLASAHPDDAGTFNANGRVRKIDHLLHTCQLAARPVRPAPIGPDTPLPSSRQPSDHLPLEAVLTWTPGPDRT